MYTECTIIHGCVQWYRHSVLILINIMRTKVIGQQSPNYRQQAAHVAIVVTDGKSNYDQNQTILSANEAMKHDIIMLAEDVTFKVDVTEILDIASEIPTYNTTGLEEANAKVVFVSKGLVSYVLTINEFDGIVSQLLAFLSKAICVYGKCNFHL